MASIPEFFSGKNIFITGGSGFLGKILIEKLLRSCPEVKNLYLLLREKKGKDPDERLKSIIDCPVSYVRLKKCLPYFNCIDFQIFDGLRCRADIFKKLKVIVGDIEKIGLGKYEICWTCSE